MNCKTTKPAFNVGPSSALQPNAINGDNGPLVVILGSSLPSSTKKTVLCVGPPLTTLSGSAHEMCVSSFMYFVRLSLMYG